MNERVFIDNCAPATTNESLKELFQGAGNVASVTIPDKQDRASEIHAFIKMASSGEAATAIQMFNGSIFNGRRLTVTRASPVHGVGGVGGGKSRAERKNG